MCDHGLYRFRYTNQQEATSSFLSRKSSSLAGLATAEKVRREGESDQIFYMSRVRNIGDIEKLPGHKDIWKINSVKEIKKRADEDYEVTFSYQRYGNLRHDYRVREKEKTIVIKRKWNCFNELMEHFSDIKGDV